MASRKKKTTGRVVPVAKVEQPEVFDLEAASEEAQVSHVQRLAKAHTEDAIRALVEIATNEARADVPDPDGKFQPTGETFDYAPGPRATAASRLIEIGHGRIGGGSGIGQRSGGTGVAIKVVIENITGDGVEQIDITPSMEQIESGSSPS